MAGLFAFYAAARFLNTHGAGFRHIMRLLGELNAPARS